MIRYDLRGRRALVTGGASGIGLATVRMLAEAGARVAVNHLPGDARAETALVELRAAGHDVLAAPGNVGDAVAGPRMVEQALAGLGGLDFLVNNAGTPGTTSLIPPTALELLTEELWQAVLQVNLLGVFRCAKAAAPALKEAGGAVVNVASIAGIDSPGSSMAYGATKAGVISLTKNLARGLAPDVRVNAIAPGAVDSPWMVEWTEERRQASASKALLKRRCQPEDLAEVILFLLAGARMVTGQTLVVDGGLTLEAR
ncbi:SDR family NAD(P)-dependent oxidoreductase [Roseomonas marmotae]|uniref:SDR family oxidoreductase n=1 Tax=Roseomonas marmotae TaxID=2768161 RepID=A0ABS3KCV5_9PROT|nr:SDR family oxidoreductase [Roseomonas marmotae]MBO1074765.1 SDR family oxidoreductase [Roseomonas marmotae]QTI80725.1 SDR family oxidoreductase [Roseomonas marmotae]